MTSVSTAVGISFSERVQAALAALPTGPNAARHQLKQLIAEDGPVFRALGLGMLPGIENADVRRTLLELMWRAGLVPPCNPAGFSLEEEMALARELVEIDPSFDVVLARRLSGPVPLADVALRILELLGAIPLNSLVVSTLVKLLHDPNPRIRSKATLIIGKARKPSNAGDHLLADSDPRVRANAIEALWGVDTLRARSILKDALRDRNNRVVGNALLGLFLLDETSAIPRILAMAAHPEACFRATAAWVMQQTGNPRFVPVLSEMIRETEPRVRTRVFRGLAALKKANPLNSEAMPLRVHILSVSSQGDGTRTLRAAIAAADGTEAAGVCATRMLIRENSRLISDYSVRNVFRPPSLALALVFPEGPAGDAALAALEPAKREQDRWTVVRYRAGASLAAIKPALAFLASGDGNRHVIFGLPQFSNDEAEVAVAAAELAQARSYSATVHSVRVEGTTALHAQTLVERTDGLTMTVPNPEAVQHACEKIHLHLLHGYEITYRTPDLKQFSPEIKLEVFSPDAYGADTAQVGIPGN